ncbi:autotransporter-associated beta strand repeat protein [Pirellula staleyi DSM 6068]|uniref:Autotransporter-associated beta strand repeat protein n=1 Tax=Pirellula staleyi (strain ATCC 27377 / DSM 6068 / ICPB 4128) TaxID=530564 RepID=D2R9I1_PIRSD|nr:LamG-like jellyroll fold domain-containing protein [Pirellula staleyi]ADB17731.1 autotransporter-associated beta strand repeat protein [Pirellula staleyi DSM 6068]
MHRQNRRVFFESLEDRSMMATIPYIVPQGTVGNQPFTGSLGMDFDVTAPITVTNLGAFDSGSDGINGTINVRLYDRTNPGTPLATASLSGTSQQLVGGSRFLSLLTPIPLPAGFQGRIVTDGYSAAEPNGNSATPVWTTNGGGAMNFVGVGTFDTLTNVYPTNSEGTPVNRYAAGTFAFVPQAITTAYVEDSWSAFSPGHVIADADAGTTGNQPAVIGVDAFASISTALAAVPANGTVIVNDGTYAEAVTMSGTKTLEITGPNGAQSVAINSLISAVGQNVIIEGTSTLTVGDASNSSIAGVISGSGNLAKNGGGSLTLSNINTYTGTTNIIAGTLSVTGQLSNSTDVTVGAAGVYSVAASDVIDGLAGTGSVLLGTNTLTVGGGNIASANFGGVISGSGGVTKVGSGTQTFSGANNYTGITNISAGILTAAHPTALGSTVAGTVISNGASLGLSGNIALAAEAISAVGSGVGGLGAIRNLSGNNSVAGAVTMQLAQQLRTPLTTATSSFSQGGFTPAALIDNNFNLNSFGWANAGNAGGSNAVFETGTNLNPAGIPTTIDFSILSGGYGQHTIGRFKIYATTDDRSLFADGVINGGDVTANWIDITPAIVTSANGATLTILGDNSVRASGASPESDTYTIRAVTSLANITGFRLETIKDASFPSSGPGRAANGNYVIVEFSASVASELTIGSDAGSSLQMLGTVHNPFSEGTVSLVGAGNIGFSSTSGITQTSGVTGVSKSGTGTVTNAGALNNFAGVLSVSEGVYVAAHASAVGASTGTTVINSGATLTLSGGITITGETITVNGNGAAGTLGALTSAAGNNSIDATSQIQAAPAITQFSVGSTGGTFTISAPIDMHYARLVVNGDGNTALSGAISATLPTEPSLANLNSLPTGNYEFEVGGQTVSVRVENDGVNSWLLVGRGRNGWEFDNDGQQVAAAVNSGLGTNAAFAPAAYSASLINDILGQSGLSMSNVEVRIRRAQDAAGTVYQENRWRDWPITQWSWNFSNPGTNNNTGGVNVTREIVSGLGSPLTYASNTRDSGEADGRRIFTWAWDGHGSQRGFSYGSSIGLVGGQSVTNFLWELGSENHEIPYSEVYIRTLAAPPVQDNSLIKNGTGTLTLGGANTFAGTTTVNAGTVVAAHSSALGTTAGGTVVSGGATLALSGGITIDGEAIQIAGSGAAGQAGALVNLAGANTLGATTSILVPANVPNRLDVTAVGGSLSIASPINLQYARLVVGGAGDVDISGDISSTLPTSPTLATLGLFPTGDYTITAAGQTFNARIQNDGTTSWLLIGRGRDGWQFDTDGQGLVSDVNQNLGTVAGFAPAAYSDAIVNALLAQVGTNNTGAELRILRATDTAGINPYQETRWFNFATPNFTFDFDVGSSGIPMTSTVYASSINGISGPRPTNTRDSNPPFGNDATRIFTWAWGGHNNRQGFSYGTTISGIDNNSPTSYLWEFTTENHALAYSEVSIRTSTQITVDSGVTKTGTGSLTLSGSNTYTGTTVVNQGTLIASDSSALGTAAAGTEVNEGGTLALTGGITIAGESLIVRPGTSVGNDHLVNLAGANTWTGPIDWQNPLATTSTGLFTGGDIGEGLDLTGTFPYAINFGGTATGPVQGTTFTSSEGAGTPGLSYSIPSVINSWFAPDYGVSADDNNLEAITQSIRYGGLVNFTLANLVPGSRYKLQLIIDESNGYTLRGSDLFIDGQRALTGYGTAASSTVAIGGVITHEFTATTSTVRVLLDGNSATGFSDRNPILNAATLELLSAAAPTSMRIRSDAGQLTLGGEITVGAANGDIVVGGAGNVVATGTIVRQNYSDAVTALSPLNYWRLNDAVLPTALDEMGTRNGTYVNVPAGNLNRPGAFPGDLNNSVQFNTSGTFANQNRYVSIPSDAALNATLQGNYTAQMWIYKDGESADWQRLFGKGFDPTRTFGLFEEAGAPGRILFQVYTSGGNVNLNSTESLAVGQWHHVAVTKDGSTISLYINGNLSASTTLPGVPVVDASPLTIGKAATIHQDFPGRIDEVALYGSALTRAQIASLYAAGAPVYANGLTKTGAGTLTLTANNQYIGATSVLDGTLLVNNVAGSGTGSGNVTASGDAVVGGTGAISGALLMTGVSTLSPGASPETLATGNLSLGSGTTFLVEIGGTSPGNGTTGYDQVNVTGTVTIASGVTLDLDQLLAYNVSSASLTSFTIISNDGTDAVAGTFSGLAEGASLSYAGGTLYISYAGGDGNDVVLSSQPLMQGTSLDDTFVVTGAGNIYTVTRTNSLGIVTATYTNPPAGILNILGSGGDDTLIVDSTGTSTDPIPSGGINYDGQSQTMSLLGDMLSMRGTTGQVATYLPSSSTPGAGTITIEDTLGAPLGVVTFTGLEPVDISGFAVANVNFPNANDVVDIINGFDAATGLTPALIVSGNSGGVAFEQVHLFSNVLVNINTFDGGGSDGVDSVTITSGANAHANANITIDTGVGADTIEVDGPLMVGAGGAISLTSGGSISVNNTITAGLAVTLTALTGSISDGNGASVNVATGLLVAQAATGVANAIDLDTTITSLIVSTTGATNGNININETSGLAVSSATTVNGNITLTAASGDIAVTTITAVGDATLVATTGAITDANAGVLNLSANNLSATSATGIDLDTSIATLTASVTGTGAIDIDEASAITLTSITTNNGLVDITSATGTMTVTSINAAGAVNLAVTDTGAADDDIIVSGTLSSTSNVVLLAGDDATLSGTISATGTVSVTIDAASADVGGATLSFAGDIDAVSATFTGGAEIDTFNVRPDQDNGLASTPISIFGGDPTVPAGDLLVLDITGLGVPTLTLGAVDYSGVWSFGASAAGVAYSSIETVQTTPLTSVYNLVLDMRIAGFQNGAADAIEIFLSAPNVFEVEVNGLGKFSGQADTINSFTVIGSSDSESLTIRETAAGLPSFDGAAPLVDNSLASGGVSNGAHLNIAADAYYTASNLTDVTIHFDGGLGDNSLALELLTAADVGYFSDVLDGQGSGNVGVGPSGAPLTLVSFADLDTLILDGAGGNLVVDASSSTSTADIEISDDGAAADGVTEITADTGLVATTTFEGFLALDLIAGGGNEAIDLVNIDSTSSLTSIDIVAGSSLAATDNSAHTVRIHAIKSGVPVTVTGDIGVDTFQVFDSGNSASNIASTLSFNGVAGDDDSLIVVDSGSVSADSVVITRTTIEGLTIASGIDITFTSIDDLDVTTSGGADTIRVNMTEAANDLDTAVVTGAGDNDQFYVNAADFLARLTLNGGLGDDTFGGTPSSTAPGYLLSASELDGVDDMIRPSLTTPFFINGNDPSVLPGDVLNIDVSALGGGLAATSPVLVSSGQVLSSTHATVTFTTIEDLNLADDGEMTSATINDIYIRGTNGNDTIQFARANTTLEPSRTRVQIGSSYTYHNVPGKTLVYGRGGNDIINQSNLQIPAEFYGEAGDDFLTGSFNNDLLVGGLGNDRINASSGNNIVWGDDAPTSDELNPHELNIGGNDTLSALGGNDIFYAGGGNDSVSPGAGDDWIHGGYGNDQLSGSSGNDRIYGAQGNDTISGDVGDDFLSGGDGDDRLYGRDGNDVLIGGDGVDLVDGGNGNDLVLAAITTYQGTSDTATSNTYSSAVDAAMLALLVAWNSGGPVAPNLTHTDDLDRDTVYGGSGNDLFGTHTNADPLTSDIRGDFNNSQDTSL